MKGRKSKPGAIRILEGNPGHRPLPKNEPNHQKAIKSPNYIKNDRLAIQEWNRIILRKEKRLYPKMR